MRAIDRLKETGGSDRIELAILEAYSAGHTLTAALAAEQLESLRARETATGSWTVDDDGVWRSRDARFFKRSTEAEKDEEG
jgi:hypothetical protein